MTRCGVICLLPFVVVLSAGCGPGDQREPEKTATKSTEQTNPPKEPAFTPLSLADFETHIGKLRRGEKKPAGPTWSENDGVISCSGLPRGYIYTKKPYQNFVLEFEYRFPKPESKSDEAKLNTGCLVYIQGEHRVWPVCLEVQGKYLEMGMIKSNARHITVKTHDDPRIRTELREKPGVLWNRVTVESQEGRLIVRLNGKALGSSEPTELKEGPIGFQSEGSPVEFRNIRIRPVETAK